MVIFAPDFPDFPVTTNPDSQFDPEIYKDIVVWIVGRNGTLDICGYNLSTKEEFQITADEMKQVDPAIYENIIVWREGLGPLCDIYGCNLSTNEQFAVVAPSTQTGPAIYGDIVVWTDHRNEKYDIYGCSLSSVEWYPFGSPPAGLFEPPPRPVQGFLKLVLRGKYSWGYVILDTYYVSWNDFFCQLLQYSHL